MKNAQGQLRVLKDALESRIGRRIDGERPIAPWFVMHAASVINRGRKYHEGFTALRRWKGREFNKPVAEFGECSHYAPVQSAGRNKFAVRWVDGIWLGIKLESGESSIGTPEGVVRVRDFRRKPENGGRGGSSGIDGLKGAP